MLRLAIEAVRFVCAEGHSWTMTDVAIRQAGEGAELCPACGGVAVDATLAALSALTERRGVVLDLFGDADA